MKRGLRGPEGAAGADVTLVTAAGEASQPKVGWLAQARRTGHSGRRAGRRRRLIPVNGELGGAAAE